MPRLDYPFIRVWSRMQGSLDYYIQDEVERARKSNAPERAIYRRYATDGSGWDGKSWATVNDITDETLRERVERAALTYGD